MSKTKIVCPYCKCALFPEKREFDILVRRADEVARCKKCGLITCTDCWELHMNEAHGLGADYGVLGENCEFIPRDFSYTED